MQPRPGGLTKYLDRPSRPGGLSGQQVGGDDLGRRAVLVQNGRDASVEPDSVGSIDDRRHRGLHQRMDELDRVGLGENRGIDERLDRRRGPALEAGGPENDRERATVAGDGTCPRKLLCGFVEPSDTTDDGWQGFAADGGRVALG